MFNSVRHLAYHLSCLPDVRMKVIGVQDEFTSEDLPTWKNVDVTCISVVGPAQVGYAPEMRRALEALEPDVCHTQGLWLYPSIAVQGWAKSGLRPYLVTPRGMLDSWALENSRWKKRLAGLAYENSHLRGASCLHALCEAEAQSIRAYGLRNPICVIPNGVDVPIRLSSSPARWARSLPDGARVLLYLGRLHPKKGLPNLIEAWRMMQGIAYASDWHLVIAGWDQNGHQSQLEAQVKRAGVQNNVHFVGPQFGEDKDASFVRANAFVLPSHSEGLPMVVLEAWANRVPVLMTPDCHLPEGILAKASLEMAADPASILKALTQMIGMSDKDRREMGERGQQLVAERFRWQVIAEQMLAVYQWVLGRGPMPSTVIRD
jgi:glycosyltransferase involved in cell wall biosynthesis